MNARMLFRHPHLIRGVVHTSGGSFMIERGLVRVPAAVGAAQGWERVRPDAAEDTHDTGTDSRTGSS